MCVCVCERERERDRERERSRSSDLISDLHENLVQMFPEQLCSAAPKNTVYHTHTQIHLEVLYSHSFSLVTVKCQFVHLYQSLLVCFFVTKMFCRSSSSSKHWLLYPLTVLTLSTVRSLETAAFQESVHLRQYISSKRRSPVWLTVQRAEGQKSDDSQLQMDHTP